MGNQRSKQPPPSPSPQVPGAGKEPPLVTEQKPHVPGEGIRSMPTSQAFRALNFELYTKPNKPIMIIGVVSITLALGYLAYMRNSYNKERYYESLSEEGNIILREKKSRWES